MNDTPKHIRYITMIILGIILAFCTITTQAQTKESEWVEIKAVEMPEGLEIFSGITRNGNPKYWFEIQGIKVFVSPANKEHYTNNTATIVLVEWYNKSTDRYKYTTRQLKKNKPSKRINIDSI